MAGAEEQIIAGKNAEEQTAEQSRKESKARIRAEIRALTRESDPEYFADTSVQIAAKVTASGEYREAECLLLYSSMPAEPDTEQILEDALRRGKRVLMPRCLQKPVMEAVEIKSRADLRSSAESPYGIPEPKPELAAADPAGIDLVLIPCVAAGRDGRRLGHGAAYYDTFLGRQDVMPQTVMCLCFAKFLRDDIPEEAHDRRADLVVTENGVYRKEYRYGGKGEQHEISVQTEGSMRPTDHL